MVTYSVNLNGLVLQIPKCLCVNRILFNSSLHDATISIHQIYRLLATLDLLQELQISRTPLS
jgi:hypothetical protein